MDKLFVIWSLLQAESSPEYPWCRVLTLYYQVENFADGVAVKIVGETLNPKP